MRNDQLAIVARKRKIAELARAIRKKYLALKLGRTDQDESLNKLFQPISAPLKEIVESSKVLNSTLSHHHHVKSEVKKEEEEAEKQQTEFVPETSEINDDHDGGENENNEVFTESSDQISDDVMNDYLNHYPVIAQEYIREHVEGSPKIDKLYGPVYDAPISKWLLGGQRIDFDADGKIVTSKGWVPGTKGLYELIFYDDPQHYTKEDLKNYKSILEITNSHRDTKGRLKGSTRRKYIEIIKPMFSQRRHTTGEGMVPTQLTYNETPMEYVFWDNPNELVDRLKLLMASKEAGNTSHDNEIIAIINELREANIIR